jgi:malonate decarboxylase beta subunit
MNEAIAKGVPANIAAITMTITCPSDHFDTRQQADTEQIKQLFAREVK